MATATDNLSLFRKWDIEQSVTAISSLERSEDTSRITVVITNGQRLLFSVNTSEESRFHDIFKVFIENNVPIIDCIFQWSSQGGTSINYKMNQDRIHEYATDLRIDSIASVGDTAIPENQDVIRGNLLYQQLKSTSEQNKSLQKRIFECILAESKYTFPTHEVIEVFLAYLSISKQFHVTKEAQVAATDCSLIMTLLRKPRTKENGETIVNYATRRSLMRGKLIYFSQLRTSFKVETTERHQPMGSMSLLYTFTQGTSLDLCFIPAMERFANESLSIYREQLAIRQYMQDNFQTCVK